HGSRHGRRTERARIRRASRMKGEIDVLRRFPIAVAGAALGLATVAAMGAGTGAAGARTGSSPIQHVVIIYQENHSFDNVLGAFCLEPPVRCDGASMGTLPN